MNQRAIALLGLVTIVTYGSWYYAFGVLLDPIRIATGWSEASLATSFSLGIVAVGLGAIGGGRLLDRIGSRLVFVICGLGGGLSLLVASYSSNLAMFTVASASAMGFLGSLGFYHITMTTAVRLNAENPSKAIATLTIWGAFASVIYLPATAAVVNALDWRQTVRLLGIVVLVVFAIAVVVIPDARAVPDAPSGSGSGSGSGSDSDFDTDSVRDAGAPTLGEPGVGAAATAQQHSLRQVLASTVADRRRRSFTAAVGLGGVAMSTVLVYQVPTMTAVGLPLGTAATMAGIRGFAQTGGRIPLSAIIRRIGTDGALILAFLAMTLGGGLLAFAGTVPVALVFAIVTGFGIGAYSPLHGIKAEELFERESLGTTMGAYSTIMMLSGAIGPAVAGVLADSTDDRRMVTLVIVGSAAAATLFAIRLRRSSLDLGSQTV